MFTEYKDVRPKKGVNKPFENVFMSAAYSEIFSGRGYPNSTYISIVIFRILKHIKNKKALGGPGACSPENF